MRVLLALIVCGGIAIAQPAHIATSCGGAGSAWQTSDYDGFINTTGATLLTFAPGSYNAGVTSFGDTSGNTWRKLGDYFIGYTYSSVYYAYDKAGLPLVTGPNQQVFIGDANYSGGCFSAWSGTLADGTDPFVQPNHNGVASGGPLTTGSITASAGNLLLATFATAGGTSYAVDSGFTVRGQHAYVSGGGFGAAVAGMVAAGGAVNPSWSGGGGSYSGAIIVEFKKAAGGAPAAAKRRVISSGE